MYDVRSNAIATCGFFAFHCISLSNWEGEYNNSTETADEILANQVYKGNLYSSSEVDYYHFVMDRTGYFDISFTIPEVDAYISNGWEITIFQEQAEINSFIATSNVATCPYAFKKGTNVYIRIQAKKNYFSPTFTEYNIKITAQDNEQWEREGNGSIEVANSMKIGTTYYGTAYTNYDTDYYCVTTNKNGFFTMTFNPNDIAENLGDGYKMNLYDAENKELYSIPKVIEKSDWKFYLKKGTYYIRISVDDTYDAPSAYSIYTIDTTLKIAEKPGKTKIKSLKGTKYEYWFEKYNNVTYKLKKISSVAGYEVQLCSNKKFKNKCTSMYGTSNGTIGEKLSRKKKYYIRARAYYETIDGKKIYGAWSKIKNVTTK